jgi:hypothetical protein
MGHNPEVKEAVNWGGLRTVLIDRGGSKDSLPVIELSAATASLHQPSDRWGTRRIWIACACSAVSAFSPRMIDFLPLGASGLLWPHGSNGSFQSAIRPLFESFVLIVLALAFFAVGLLISAGIALWHRHFRRMASSLLAIAVIPICYVVIWNAPFFDPWLWYVIANHTRFEALAASNSPSSGPKFAVIDSRDVSSGLVINGNHFIDLVYDESDAIGLEPSERPSIWQTRTMFGATPFPKGKRLYGHFFRVDEFE